MSERADELRAEAERQRRSIATDLELVGDRVSPARMAQRRTAAVRGHLTTMRVRVMGDDREPVSSSEDQGLRDRVSDAASAVGDTPQKATELTQGNPLGAGLVAFGAGLLIGSLLPESETEKEVGRKLQPQVSNVAAEVGNMSRQVADEVKPAAQEAGQAVADSAKESARTVGDEAKGAAQDVKSTAQDQARTVRDEAQNQ